MRSLILAAALIVSACGSKSPAAPSPPPPPPAPTIPNFAGAFSGRAVIDRCSDNTGVGFCGSVASSSAVSLSITQSGSALSAAIIMGTSSGTTTGTGTSDGGATFNTYTFTQPLSATNNALWRFSGWNLRLNGNGLTGTFHLNLTITGGVPGNVDIDYSLQNVVR